MLAKPKNQITKPKIVTINILEWLLFSSIQAVKGSRSEIAELNAAIEIKIKNIEEIKFPKGKE